MAAMLGTIKGWFEEAEKEGASHMVVLMDSFDYEDYPLFVMPGENPRDKAFDDKGRIMECYKISLGWESQSKEHRANHWDWEPA
jgi:hypothetical protein